MTPGKYKIMWDVNKYDVKVELDGWNYAGGERYVRFEREG